MKSLKATLSLFGIILIVGVCVSLVSIADVRSNGQKSEAQPAKSNKPNSSGDKTEPQAKNKDKAKKQDPVQEWTKLKSRKLEIYNRLLKLQQDHKKADDEEKKKIVKEFRTLIAEFERKVHPRMIELAPVVYAKSPKDLDAAEIALETEYGKNRYEKSLEIAGKLIAAERKTKIVVNIAAVSHFAIHNFEKARNLLEAAQKDGQLMQQIGGRYIEYAGEYIALWKTEQEIRRREAAAQDDERLPRVELNTTQGTVVLELFENEAPNTVANFVSLVEAKKYDGTKFHRVIPGFMAQGGDPNSSDDDPKNDGTGLGYTIECECHRKDARKHFRGSLSMAHAGKDTGGAQFFLTHLPTPHLNADPKGETGHTVFGRVIEGISVVAALQIGDTVKQAKVLRKRNHAYKPKTTPTRKPETKPDRR